jgi:hypothetical protein
VPWIKGKKCPQLSGSNNGLWKGDNVGYDALHDWVKRHLPKPDLCQSCNKAPVTDLACVTGAYSRDFDNWRYFCRECHRRYDYDNGMLPKIPANRRCIKCNSDKTYVSKKGHAAWFIIDKEVNLFQCKICYMYEYRQKQRQKAKASGVYKVE